MQEYKMRVYFQVLGGHTHLNIFTGRNIENGTLGKAGAMCMTNEEFTAWKSGRINLEFVEHENTVRDTKTTAVPAQKI